MIYGKRLRLRSLERDDLPKFVEWLNDPEVRENLFVNHPFSMAEEEGRGATLNPSRWQDFFVPKGLEARTKIPASQLVSLAKTKIKKKK